jgi:hypothetical protein
MRLSLARALSLHLALFVISLITVPFGHPTNARLAVTFRTNGFNRCNVLVQDAAKTNTLLFLNNIRTPTRLCFGSAGSVLALAGLDGSKRNAFIRVSIFGSGNRVLLPS